MIDNIKPGSKVYYPPLLEDLLAWARLFRCHRTYSNYLGYARVGCLLVKASDAVRRAGGAGVGLLSRLGACDRSSIIQRCVEQSKG